MPARTDTRRFSWRLPTKSRRSTESLRPLSHRVADAFQQYIHNDIPARLIDTTKLTFVERNDVFDFFFSEIAQIAEEDILQRVPNKGVAIDPEAGIYITPRKAALTEIIRDVVKYAVFSHRWTDNEPNYQDVSAGELKQRNFKTVGLTKLARLCETARSLGYRLVWSDTCCIDKTNMTELSEAILAMYKWYAHAHVCIVHLASSSSLDFEYEPWFQRGWTLQELLAPKRIKFYDKDWHPFTNLSNDKDDLTLLSAVSAITGVPRDVVVADNSGGIKGHSIWEIMSWASTRKTTRIEDAAYCLFGLFDINLPIAYGEGEKAFPRLVEAIVVRCPTWDVFAWAGQASSRNPVLPYSPSCYPRWDEEMGSGEVGMKGFVLTSDGLRLMSVPLIPVAFASGEEDKNGSYKVTLSPRSDMTALGTYSDVTVICGSGRLWHIRKATDLHVCILNYKPHWRSRQGKLWVGKTYACFLLHSMEDWTGDELTWLKFAPDNVLRITFKGAPVGQINPERSPDTQQGMFDLPLETIYIRAPRAQL